MNRSLALLPVLLAAAFAGAQTWTKVFSPEGRFSVLMPGEPTMSSRNFDRAGITIPTTMYVVTRPGTNYLIAISTVPPSAPATLAADLAKSAKDDFIKSIQGKWLSDKNVAYNGVTGRLMTFKAPNGANGAVWIAVRGKKIFTLTVAKNKKPYAAEQAKFFGSFKLIP